MNVLLVMFVASNTNEEVCCDEMLPVTCNALLTNAVSAISVLPVILLAVNTDDEMF